MADPFEVIVTGRAGAVDVDRMTLGRGDGATIDADGIDEVIIEVRPEADTPLASDGGTRTVDPDMTVEQAARPDETVLDRLRQAYHCWPMVRMLEGRKPAAEMGYEDYTRPLKLTGGKICLRVDCPASPSPAFVERRQTGMLTAACRSWRVDGPSAVAFVRDAIDDGETDITPVLVEDTPGGED